MPHARIPPAMFTLASGSAAVEVSLLVPECLPGRQVKVWCAARSQGGATVDVHLFTAGALPQDRVIMAGASGVILDGYGMGPTSRVRVEQSTGSPVVHLSAAVSTPDGWLSIPFRVVEFTP